MSIYDSDDIAPRVYISRERVKRRCCDACELSERSKGYFFLALIGIVLLCAFIGGIYIFRLYPLAGGASIGCLSMVLYHMVTETTEYPTDAILHDHHEAENRFWGFLAGVFAFAVVFGGTPISFGRSNPFWGLATVLMCATYVYGYQRDLTRHRLRRSKKLKKSFPHVSGFDARSAKEKLKSIECDLNVIDVPSVAMRWFPSRTRAILEAETRIIDTFKRASHETLNYITSRTQLPLLFYKVKDYDVLRRTRTHHRSRLLELFAVDRVGDLEPRSKVAVLDALQKMRLHAHPRGEEFVLSVLRSTKGHDLTQLKSMMDSKGTFHNLHKLVFSDVKSSSIRTQILAHFYDEGSFVRRKSLRIRLRKRRMRKILSDVDDTLFSSGGRYPAGADRTYPRHALYPGVLAFYEELDKQDSAPTVRFAHEQMATLSNLTFLSARPHVYKDTSESVTYRKFAWLRKHRGLYTEPTLLAGSLPSGIKMFTGDYGPLAAKKVDNWLQYAALYPEFEYVFIGDNGQGDVLTAETMLKSNVGDRVEAVFIHLVKPLDSTPGARPGGRTTSPVSSPAVRALSPTLSPMRSADDGGSVQAFSLNASAADADEVGSKLPIVETSVTASAVEDVEENSSSSGGRRANRAMSNSSSTSRSSGIDSETNEIQIRVREAADVSSATETATETMTEALDMSEGSARWKRMGIIFFHTYIEAARKAVELEKLTFDGAVRVARSALRDFYTLDEEKCWDGGLAGTQRESARLQLNRDVSEFNRFARKHPNCSGFKPLPFISCTFAPQFPLGDAVVTTWGPGKVIRRRERDAMYEVELTRWRLAGRSSVRLFCPGIYLSRPRPCEVGDRVCCKYGGVGTVTGYRFRDGMYTVRVDSDRTMYLHYSALKSRVPAVLGDVVRVSVFGIGVVVGWRYRDRMYAVELFWGRRRSSVERRSSADSAAANRARLLSTQRTIAYVSSSALKLVPRQEIPLEISEASLSTVKSPTIGAMSSISSALCSWGSREREI